MSSSAGRYVRLTPARRMLADWMYFCRHMPLVVAEGAGAEMRRTLGTAVFAGMLGVTLFGVFLTPVFFYVIQAFTDWRASRRGETTAPPPAGPSTNGAVSEQHVTAHAH